MPLAQHKHHRDTRSPGAPVGEQASGQSVSLQGHTLSRPGTLTLLLGSLPARGLACTFSFCINLWEWHLAKPTATAAAGREGWALSLQHRGTSTEHPHNPANRAHLLLKLTLTCLFSPGANAISPRFESRAFCSDLSTYRPVGCPPRSRVCSPPQVGAPPLWCWHMVLASSKNTFSKSQIFLWKSRWLEPTCYFWVNHIFCFKRQSWNLLQKS